MWKPLVVLAIVANTALITPSEGTNYGPYPEDKRHGNKCANNETLDPCYSGCPPRYCGVNIAAVSCPVIDECDCKPGCRCRDEYSRDGNGNCILTEDCPECLKKNQVYDVCPYTCPPRRCDVDDRLIDCMPPPKPGDPECKPGCRCADGHAMNDAGDCIPREQCPQEKCRAKPNEEYKCVNSCPQQYKCDVDPRLIKCRVPPELGDPNCEPGCECIQGHARDDNGKCIPRDRCPQEKCRAKQNEEYQKCLNPCPLHKCDVDPSTIRCMKAPKPGDANCHPGCECIADHARNDKGICIPRDQCPKKCKGKHEIYSKCPALVCRPLNCTQVGFPLPCPLPGPDPSKCPGEPGCICESGYARSKHGKCISIKKCQCGGDSNAKLGSGNCGRHCSDRHNKKPCSKKCKDESLCKCRKGFWYDDYLGKCVRSCDCTPTCSKDEVLSNCTNSECRPQKCSQLGFSIPCPKIDPKNCIKGCLCKDDWVRAPDGTCVPRNKCSSCGGDPNAVSGCGNCRTRCSNYNSTDHIMCIQICDLNGCDCKKNLVVDDSTGKCIHPKKCVSCGGDFNAKPGCDKDCIKRCPGPKPAKCKCYEDGCVCKHGFRYDPKTGKCVRPKECTPPCGDNEVLSNCSNGGCQPRNCSQLGKPFPCKKMDPKDCIVACVCKEGYYWNLNGICVPKDKCEINCTGENEVVDLCPPICPPQTCESINRTYFCPRIKLNCKPACRCKKDHYRDPRGKCVSKENCLKCPGPNEYWSCGGACDNVCKDLNEKSQADCPIFNIKCNDMCYCLEGFARDTYNICIPFKNCPAPTCGKDEVPSNCTNSECRPQKCSQLGFSIPCPRIDPKKCIKGCLCKDDWVRASNGTCIPKNKCSSCGGDPNAVSGCGNCRKRCSNYNSTKPIFCNKLCNLNGCVCKKDLVVDDSTGKCIDSKKCVSCAGDYNAEPGCDKDCIKRCPGPKPAKCKCYEDGCVCKPGFKYDPIPKKCVRPEECSPPCGDNEVLSNCSNGGCGPWRCTDVGHPTGCVKMDQKYCTVGCVCQEGFVRDENERCINITDCPQECKEHEVYNECINGGCDARNCSQLGQPIPCVKLDAKSCIKGCICEEGYLFALNGTCVPIDQCDNCNKANEHYDSCAPTCPPQTCESIGRQYKCPIAPAVCKGACRCDPGYYRDQRGECLSEKDCLIARTCGKDEVFSDCINGGCSPKNCSQLGKPIRCVKIDPKYCKKGCVCKEGYLLDRNGICVPKEKCNPICTGENEEYDSCPPSCPPQTCESINKTYNCPLMKIDEKDCKGACRCKPDFYRDQRGQCVSKANCLKCTGPNEFWSCGGACDNVCKTLHERSQVNCPIVNIRCNDKCYCLDGYARNKSNICIPFEECPEVNCGINEKYDICANGGCQKRNCSQVGQPTLCIDPLKCIGGCVCKESFLLDQNGCCVPEKECPLKCTKQHEVYDPCPHTCPPQTCEAIGIAYPCPNPPQGKEFCNPACRCEDGYYRNSADDCISEANCLQCTKPNEHFACGPECDNVCATLSTQNRTNCPIKNKRCIEKCYCDDNFARDLYNNCIPISQCNESCKGDPNAVPGCSSYCQRCSNRNESNVICPLFCLLDGCDCKPLHIYDDNIDRCVLPENCTPTCKKNEVYNACINGGCQKKKCSDLGRPDICVHPKECIGGCLCDKGFLQAENGTCVLINNCPKPVCPKYKVFDTCANGGCGRRTCQELTGPEICRDVTECIGDCVCDKGRLLNEDGDCVLESECNPTCPRPHEVFNHCPSTCPPQTCESLDRAYVCPINRRKPCEPACVCEDDFFKNALGECISRANCLKCMGQFEYFSCGVECDNVCETLNEQSKDDCPYVNIQCNEKCYCLNGYARNKSNSCIPIEQCPPPRCGPDERWEESPCRVCEPLTCDEVGDEMDCPPVEDNDCDDTPGCICKNGLVRDEYGDCIPISKCSSECTVNLTEANARLNQGIASLSAKFLQYLNSENPNENSVASATSLMIPLAQLTLWAKDGPVLDELLNLLNLKCKDEIKAVFKDLTNGFKNQSQVEFEVASKTYANENYPLSDAFKNISAEIFDASGQNVDFSLSKEVADLINAWVSDRTRGKITDLVNQDMFDANTRLCLVNAIYFLGNWVYQFNPNKTEVKDFYKSNGESVPLKFMYQENNFKYAENDKFQVLEMLYKGNNFSFVVVLPRSQDEFSPTLATLSEPGEWNKIMQSLETQKVQVTLPKITIKTRIDLKQLLIKFGVTKIFETSDGFEGLLEKPEPVFVSDAVQQAFIAVDETGTEAAAATAITVSATSAMVEPPETKEFKATHPFIFNIVFKSIESSNKIPLFCGTFVGAE